MLERRLVLLTDYQPLTVEITYDMLISIEHEDICGFPCEFTDHPAGPVFRREIQDDDPVLRVLLDFV